MTRIPDELLRCYFERFVTRTDAYNRQWTNGKGYSAVYRPVTLNLLAAHMKGLITIGLFALSASKDAQCKWCCWDSDAANGALDRLESTLRLHGWRTIREAKREGRDGHLWVLFDEPVPAADIIRFGAAFERAAGVTGIQNLEFFPKQSFSEKVGSAVRAPLGIQRKPSANGARGWFDEPDPELIAQLVWLCEQTPNSGTALRRFSEELRLREPPIRQPVTRNGTGRRGRPILELIPESQRHLKGREYVTQCPVCATIGEDNSKNNLHISRDGKKFCCWYGGKPGKIHTAASIIKALNG